MTSSTSNSYVIIQTSEERYVRDCSEMNETAFFVDVSEAICFDDCSNDTVEEICYKGQLVHYVGWQPGMVYEYADTDGNIVWSGSFPQWDH